MKRKEPQEIAFFVFVFVEQEGACTAASWSGKANQYCRSPLRKCARRLSPL
jgi:hypothetical protein